MTYDLNFQNLNFAHKIDDGPVFSEIFEEHFHLLYEIIFLLDGDVELILENKLYHLEVGDMIFIKPGQHHYVSPNPKRKYERFVIKFPEELISSSIIEELKNTPVTTTIKKSVLPELFYRLDWHYQNYKGNDIANIMLNVLNEILSYFLVLDKEVEKKEINFLNKNIEEVVEYINDNIDKEITIKDICEEFHYSRSYICKEFTRCLQVPIKQYIRTKKILYANSLIQSGVKPTEVYSLCGYNEYSTFYRNYLSIMGKAPGA